MIKRTSTLKVNSKNLTWDYVSKKTLKIDNIVNTFQAQMNPEIDLMLDYKIMDDSTDVKKITLFVDVGEQDDNFKDD